MYPIEFKNTIRSTFLKVTVVLTIMCSFGCSEQQNEHVEKEKKAKFVLEDSIRIDIPYGFGVVTPEAKDSTVLLYSYIDEHFFLLDYSGEQALTEYYFRGDGPKEYSGILQYAGIYNKQPFFIDHQKILFFLPKENALDPVRWHYPFPVKHGGMPNLSADFLDHNKLFVNNLSPSIYVKKNTHVKPTLDTIPVWKYLEYDERVKRFEVKRKGFLNEKSGYYSDKRLFSYQFKSWVNKDKVYSLGGYVDEILVYDGLNSMYPTDNIQIKIPGFEQPKGFSEPLTINNHEEINDLSDKHSYISQTYLMENRQLFLTYSLGVNDIDLENRVFKGYWFNYEENKGKNVMLPKENGENSSWYNRIAYLGNNRFLFVQNNEKVERDFHTGYIYRLDHAN
ncbi:hypothetical protein [Echinicola vietnamensis]|uniref:Uncharacterized protein n=1 Tax=Echinicola vietnamensis (strain DSM 17526 / LMG 23754 / KMM 6221) TaxID=926556 RepID=L0G1Q9_ECHVK|nr:hypothetical protein [Echinicola vietnamensis]AGA78790.1 hypothetical protein Echvi_2544 [Echinicola vietnamensis DSM 17526]